MVRADTGVETLVEEGRECHRDEIGSVDPPSPEEVAYHEAGHAVVAHALGMRLARVTIVPTDAYAGTCEHRRQRPRWRPRPAGDDPAAQTEAEQEAWRADTAWCMAEKRRINAAAMAVDLAGALAAHLHEVRTGVWPSQTIIAKGQLILRPGMADDFSDAWSLAWAVGEPGEDRFQVMAAAQRRAAEILRAPGHWQAVEDLAAALLAQGELDGGGARRLIARAVRRGAREHQEPQAPADRVAA